MFCIGIFASHAWEGGEIYVEGSKGVEICVKGYKGVKNVKSCMAKSLPVENLLPQNAGSITNYLQ